MKESGTFDIKSKLPLLKNVDLKKIDLKKIAKTENQESEASNPGRQSLKGKTSPLEVIRILGLALYRLRALLLAIPVLIVAFRLAAYNSEHLPLLVGLDLQSNGEFAHTISRHTAVTLPLFLTGGCLALTVFSRKTMYPWLISVFSLVIPVLLLITNMYPA